jgi:hypothetical protein
MRPLIRKGLSNADIIARLPGFKPAILRSVAAKLRQQEGLTATPGRYQKPLLLPTGLHDVLAREALARSDGPHVPSANDLALQLLGTIVRDDLFDAILDDGRG